MKGNTGLTVLTLLLGTVAFIFWYTTGDTVNNKELRNFAISDTAAIDRIFIADQSNRSIWLKRESADAEWQVEDPKTKEVFRAQQNVCSLLLKTFKRIKVKAPVPANALENIIKNIAGSHAKVEIYMSGEKIPAKMYWVGNPTKDHYGTYMLLETTDEGRSSVPFVMEMPGFYGFLSSRFHADIYQWRHSGIFNYAEISEIKSLSMLFNEEPEKSFTIGRSGNRLQFTAPATDNLSQPFDTLMVRNYLSFYKKVHFERFETRTEQVNIDSILNTQPLYTIRATNTTGEETRLDVFRKPNELEELDENGERIPFDRQRMYGRINHKDLVTLQLHHINHLFVPAAAFQ